MFYNKTWDLYKRTTNAYKVKSFWSKIATIKLKLEPIRERQDSFDWNPALNNIRMYSDYTDIEVGNKIVVENISYIVRNVELWDWVLSKYILCLIEKSEWN